MGAIDKPQQGDIIKVVYVWMPLKLKRSVEARCTLIGTTTDQYIRDLIKKDLQDEKS